MIVQNRQSYCKNKRNSLPCPENMPKSINHNLDIPKYADYRNNRQNNKQNWIVQPNQRNKQQYSIQKLINNKMQFYDMLQNRANLTPNQNLQALSTNRSFSHHNRQYIKKDVDKSITNDINETKLLRNYQTHNLKNTEQKQKNNNLNIIMSKQQIQIKPPKSKIQRQPDLKFKKYNYDQLYKNKQGITNVNFVQPYIDKTEKKKKIKYLQQNQQPIHKTFTKQRQLNVNFDNAIKQILDHQRKLQQQIQVLKKQQIVNIEKCQKFVKNDEKKNVIQKQYKQQINKEESKQKLVKNVNKQSNTKINKYSDESVLKFLKKKQENKSNQQTQIIEQPKQHKSTSQLQKIQRVDISTRLIISQQQRQQFWDKFKHKVDSQHYDQTYMNAHWNKKIEKQYYTNTVELHKKLKNQVISKIYSQVNNLVFK